MCYVILYIIAMHMLVINTDTQASGIDKLTDTDDKIISLVTHLAASVTSAVFDVFGR